MNKSLTKEFTEDLFEKQSGNQKFNQMTIKQFWEKMQLKLNQPQ